MRRCTRRLVDLVLLLAAMVCSAALAPPAFASVPRARVAAAAARDIPGAAHLGAPLAAARRLPLTIALAPRDPLALHAFASAVSTPGSRVHGDYLSVRQFARRFGATPAAIMRVRRALRHDGFRIGRLSANALTLKVSATVAQVQRSLQTSITQVRLPDGRRAYTNTTAATLPAGVAADVQGVIGLDSADLPQSQIARHPSRVTRRAHGSALADGPAALSPDDVTGGPQPCPSATQAADDNGGGYTADQLANSYSFSPLYSAGDFGQGQTVALYELGQPYPVSDVASFNACYTLGGATINPNVTLVPVDGGPGAYGASSDDGEVTLDIDVVAEMAPRANILVYSGPETATAPIDTLSAIVSQDAAKVVSISYGGCEQDETPSDVQAENTLLEEAAGQGQTVFSASGDAGDATCSQSDQSNTELSVSDPASQPFNTSVGGTYLDADAAPPQEQVWNDADGSGSGGGLSLDWAMPTYQSGASRNLGVINADSIVPGISCGSTYCREVPDVSADADQATGYVVYSNGGWTVTGGTSGSSPFWASLAALADASGTCRGLTLGFANPALYAIASSSYLSDFNDIGATPNPIGGAANNDVYGVNNGLFPTTAGYDMTTGLGSPIAATLAGSLCASRAPVYSVTVANPGTQRVIVGQPFSLAVHGADSGGVPVAYSASGLPAGLGINAQNGVIAGTPTTVGATTVTVAAGDNDANAGSTAFVIDVVKPSAPAARKVRLSGLTTGEPKLSFTLTSRSGTLTSLTIALPKGLSFSRHARDLRKGLTIKAGRRAVAFKAKVRRGRLELVLRKPETTVKITVQRPALTITHAEARAIARGKVKRLHLRIGAVNSLAGQSNERVTVRHLH